MGRDSWQLRFLSAQISRDINNEWHGRTTSAAAQRARDLPFLPFALSSALPLSLYVLIPFFFFTSPDLSPFLLPCSLFSPSPSSFARVMANINLSLPHRCICTLFLFTFFSACLFTCLMKHEARVHSLQDLILVITFLSHFANFAVYNAVHLNSVHNGITYHN